MSILSGQFYKDARSLLDISRSDQKDSDWEQIKDKIHVNAHEDGGVALNDKQLIAAQREAIKEWLAAIGKKLMTGQINLLNTSFPVKIFEPRSYLQKMSDSWSHTRFLHHAATAADAVDRMKMIIAWYVAGSNHSFDRWGKPFNPILGETWQAKLSDGTQLYMEQISHRPPITAFQMVGPDELFVFEGTSQPQLQVVYSQGGFKSTPKGQKVIRFKDGSRVHLFFAAYLVRGIINAPKPRAEMIGTARFVDQQNCLVAEIVYGPVKGAKDPILKRADSFSGQILQVGAHSEQLELQKPPESGSLSLSGMFSTSKKMWGKFVRTPSMSSNVNHSMEESYNGSGNGHDDSSENNQSCGNLNEDLHRVPSEQYSYQAMDKEEDDKVMSTFSGSWCSHLDFDGERFWTLQSERDSVWLQANKDICLPSDCQNREDLIHLKRGENETAQIWKTKLEELQRADRKLRPSTDFE